MRALLLPVLCSLCYASPVTFSNFTSTNQTPAGLPSMDFSLFEDGEVMRVVGPTYGLNGFGTFTRVSQTLTASFTLSEGYSLRGVVMNGNLGFDGTSAVGESIVLDLPCHLGSLGPCLLDTPITSGTLSITLAIWATSCGGCHGFGTVGPASLLLLVDAVGIQTVPEPSYFMLAGIAVLLLVVVMGGRRYR